MSDLHSEGLHCTTHCDDDRFEYSDSGEVHCQSDEGLYQGDALRHLPGGSMLPPGQSSILDQPVPAAEAAEVTQAHAKAKPKPKGRANTPDPQERRRRNQETYVQRWDGYQDDRRWDWDRRHS